MNEPKEYQPTVKELLIGWGAIAIGVALGIYVVKEVLKKSE